MPHSTDISLIELLGTVGMESVGDCVDFYRFSCTLFGYTSSLSQLQILLQSPDSAETFFLTFMDVLYVSGITKWQGASFYKAKSAEKQPIVQRLESYGKIAKQSEDGYELYVSVPSNNMCTKNSLRILSGVAFMAKDVDPLNSIFESPLRK